MRKGIWGAALALALAGCNAGPQVLSDPHTGSQTYYSSRGHAYDGLLDWLAVRPFYSNKAGYGVETTYSNYGWIFPKEAWSYGKQLQYQPLDSQTGLCGGAGGCITLETGLVLLSKSDFEQAAQSGFAFKIVGTSGSVEGNIAPKQFKEVLDSMPR